MKSKKILSINLGNYGSTGTIMREISKKAEESGFIAYQAFPDNDRNNSLENNDIIICSKLSKKISEHLGILTGFYGCFSYFSTKGFIKKIKKIKPDIIHLHNLHGGYINIPLLFKYIKHSDAKIFWTLHDCWSFTGHCSHFEYINCHRWKRGCHNCPQLNEYPKSCVDRTKTMYKLKKKWFSDIENLTLITPSQWLARLVKQSFLSEYPIKVINNGIDLSVFKPTESDFKKIYNCEDKFVILGVAFGWGKKSKGLDVFIELSKRLDDRFQIVVVGTDDEVDRQLPENIISIHKTQNQKELAEIYTASDLFVNPTREEVFGLVNIESLACGTPVITFDSGGSSEIPDETCGVVIPKDDIVEMISQILSIYNNNNFTLQACLEHAKSFNMYDKYKEYLDLYERQINDKKPIY